MYTLGCASCQTTATPCGGGSPATAPAVPAHHHWLELVAVAVATYLLTRRGR